MKDWASEMRRRAQEKQHLERRMDVAMAFLTGFVFAMAISVLYVGVTS